MTSCIYIAKFLAHDTFLEHEAKDFKDIRSPICDLFPLSLKKIPSFKRYSSI